MTYSILALEPKRRILGVAVASGAIAVGSRVPWAKAFTGAVATQAYTNPSLGPIILKLIELGYRASKAVKYALTLDPKPELRQVAAIDIHGDMGVHTGTNTPQWSGELIDKDNLCLCIGNLICGSKVLEEMHKAYVEAEGKDFAERLLLALSMGHRVGGDKRGDRSAAILIVGTTEYSPYYDKILDLRVDYSLNPVEDLIKLYKKLKYSI